MSAQQERKIRLIAQGICSKCGKEKLKSTTMCEGCLNKCNERYTKLRQERLDNHLCVDCGATQLASKTMCEWCLRRTKVQADTRKNKHAAKNICTRCGKNPLKSEKQCAECMSKEIERNNAVKDKVFAAYGGYICSCCGENELAFLSIDHINNDGCKHRKEVGSGSKFYWWLARNNFPSGFQVLCMNCQFGKKKYGVCPHKMIIPNSDHPSIFHDKLPGRLLTPSPSNPKLDTPHSYSVVPFLCTLCRRSVAMRRSAGHTHGQQVSESTLVFQVILSMVPPTIE